MSKRVNLKAISFDGSNDHVLISDQDDFSFGDGSGNDKPFTFSAWVFIEDVTGVDEGPFITKGEVGGGTNIEYIFKHRQGQLRAFVYRGDNTGTNNRIRLQANAASISNATWTHVVLTYDGSLSENGLKFYTNGSATAATAAADGDYSAGGGTRNSNEPLIIGKTNNANANAAQTYEDRMADVCIFNKELSAAEVSELYNSGRVKNMLKATTYGNLISWWKMGDDLDTTDSGGIRDYVSGYNGTVTNGAGIVTVPALPTDRIGNNGVMIPTTWGRTRQPKNIAGDHQVYIHGGISGDMPTALPTTTTDGYPTENQRYLHMYWKAAQTNKTHTITAFGYKYSTGIWAPLKDITGADIVLTTTNAAVDKMYVYEAAAVDRIYFQQSDAALLATDLFVAAMSTF